MANSLRRSSSFREDTKEDEQELMYVDRYYGNMGVVHSTLGVVNIKEHVPYTLDYVSNNNVYTQWCNSFDLHLRTHRLKYLIKYTFCPMEINEGTHRQLDAIVLQWMFLTMTNDLASAVMRPDNTAKQVWDSLEVIFREINQG